jgi:small-conductance mechanosensitive channel
MTSRLIALSTILFFLFAAAAAGQTADQNTEPAENPQAAAVAAGPVQAPATSAPAETASESQVLEDFQRLLRAHPDELSTIIRLDPSLLANAQFLARYPELEALVAQYPQLGRNPRLYVDRASLRSGYYTRREPTAAETIAEMVSIMVTVLIIALAVVWLIRTIIEQRRWSRLAKVQSEAHGKLLDRLTQNEDLLRYIESPAGSRFLESAPIQVSTGSTLPRFAPASSMLWSLQIGIIVAAGSLGILLVSGFLAEGAREMLAMGVIGLCIGLGFAASGIVASIVSKKLGLEQNPPAVRAAGE